MVGTTAASTVGLLADLTAYSLVERWVVLLDEHLVGMMVAKMELRSVVMMAVVKVLKMVVMRAVTTVRQRAESLELVLVERMVGVTALRKVGQMVVY